MCSAANSFGPAMRALAILLTFLILAQTFVSTALSIYYQLNKTYIATKLCENRNNPKVHCNGHCFLTKQMKKAEEGANKAQALLIKEKQEITVSFSTGSAGILPVYTQTSLYKPFAAVLPAAPVFDIPAPPDNTKA